MKAVTRLFLVSMVLVLLGTSAIIAKAHTPQQLERDRICMLAAYSLVLSDWQESNQKIRGYNIGSVLVSPENRIVCHARDSVYETQNNTQHSAVRLMTQYLAANKGLSILPDYTIYTTLEPCAMCSGMMFFTGVSRVVYGQKDLCCGGAIGRLKLDSKKWNKSGYTPYPDFSTRYAHKEFGAVKSDLPYCEELEQACAQAMRRLPTLRTTEFLKSPEAKKIYEEAANALWNYNLEYPENSKLLEDARKLVPRGMMIDGQF